MNDIIQHKAYRSGYQELLLNTSTMRIISAIAEERKEAAKVKNIKA